MFSTKYTQFANMADTKGASDSNKKQGPLNSPTLSTMFLIMIMMVFVIMMCVAMSYLFVLHKKSFHEINLLKEEVHALKVRIFIPDRDLNDQQRQSIRHKRQTSGSDGNPPQNSGNKPIVHDRAYGVDLDLKSNLHHYPYGFQSWRSSTPSSVSQTTVKIQPVKPQSGKIGNQNQLNQQSPKLDEQQDANSKSQSAYAKRINAFRHSRVSSSGRTNPQSVAPSTTIRPVLKRPQLRSLDGDGSLDKLRNSTTLHLQAKVSHADESAANLASGLHTSWRHSEWCKGNTFFKLDQTTGQIIVPDDGLYLIYVQIEYLDEHVVNGYEVYINNEPTLSCVTSSRGVHSSSTQSSSASNDDLTAQNDQEINGISPPASSGHKHKKHNTCFTSAVIYVQQGGKIHVRDKEAGRYSLLHSTGTFFGVTKLS